MFSFSIEQLGTTAYAFLTPIGDDGSSRSEGKVLADFGLQLLDPDLNDITSSIPITVEELETDESNPDTGNYKFAVPLPSTGEGNYSLRITDEWGYKHYCTFMAYTFPPHTDTRDATAQVEIEAYEGNGDAVETLAIGDLTVRIWNPSGDEVSDDSDVGVTLTKMEDGRFQLEWDCSSEEGEWFLDVIHADYFAGGQQASWRYQEGESYDPPTIGDVDTADGLTLTVEITTGDAPYNVVRLLATDGSVRDEDLVLGSGTASVTRSTSEVGILVAYGADEDGFPASAAIAKLVTGEDTPSDGAADDNVRVAIRTMKGTAVYWGFAGLDAFGKPTYEDPVVIACRWDDVQEEFIGPNGDREVSTARLIVDRDLEVKGVLYQGTLSSTVDADDPKDNDGAWEIRLFRKTPDFKGGKYLREAYL